jgi:inhibitor of KinA
MIEDKPKFFSLGENAITVEFANEIAAALNDRVLSVASYLDAHPFPGFIETFPAISSLTVFFDTYGVRRGFPEFDTAFKAVKEIIIEALKNTIVSAPADTRTHEIPVFFDEASAPDLKIVAEMNKITSKEVIDIFTSSFYRVFMIGFLPGFAYMGELDDRIAAPRKETPRVRVPKGSVGIAERQTGIYPFESPGGWQVIGKTTSEVFTADDETPCLFKAGDRVKFYQVERV